MSGCFTLPRCALDEQVLSALGKDLFGGADREHQLALVLANCLLHGSEALAVQAVFSGERCGIATDDAEDGDVQAHRIWIGGVQDEYCNFAAGQRGIQGFRGAGGPRPLECKCARPAGVDWLTRNGDAK